MREKFTINDSKQIVLLFSILSAVMILLFGCCFYQSKYSTKKFYENYELPELSIQNQVINFVQLVNTLSLDRNVMNDSIIKTYHILTDKTAAKFSSLVKENKLYDQFGEATNEVYITADPTKAADDTYELKYRVVTRLYSGLLSQNNHYKALIKIKVLSPSVLDSKDNPLGIYITDFDITQINETNKEI